MRFSQIPRGKDVPPTFERSFSWFIPPSHGHTRPGKLLKLTNAAVALASHLYRKSTSIESWLLVAEHEDMSLSIGRETKGALELKVNPISPLSPKTSR